MKTDERMRLFIETVWEWYGIHKRELPWRDMDIADADDRAYRVLVSEVMLQQTQVSRVKIVFKNFLASFPSLHDLARASNAEVILAWRGMGYNSRALRLRDAARTIMEEYGGAFPRAYDALLTIKGIGPYTAAAILNFAFEVSTPCIDTNIRRILHRTFIGPEHRDGTWKASDRELLAIAERVLAMAVQDAKHEAQDAGSASSGSRETNVRSIRRSTAQWHAALMDFGSLVQTKNRPHWDICPLTARGIMKATPENWHAPARGTAKEKMRREPGRMMGSTYVPNRIFRGKIIEALRDAKEGMTTREIGRHICMDWNQEEHEEWLHILITKLVQDALIARKGSVFVLAE